MRSDHVFIGCVPVPEECLIPNERDYPGDVRIDILNTVLCDSSSYICIVDVEEDDILNLYRKMIALSNELDSKWLNEDELNTITIYKKIFWFKDKRSYKVFKDVYSTETNELIIEQYNRIFESCAGNNLRISLNDFRGMLCRLPYDMSWFAKKGKRGGRDFQ